MWENNRIGTCLITCLLCLYPPCLFKTGRVMTRASNILHWANVECACDSIAEGKKNIVLL